VSNATDFRLLSWADWIIAPPAAGVDFDFVILPGTKDTVADLQWLRVRGLDEWVSGQHARGATVIGVCGGYQMLGEAIHDPHGAESSRGTAIGLGLLPVETVLLREKTTRIRLAATPGGVSFGAYEIHLGITTPTRTGVAAGAAAPERLSPFARLDDGSAEGMRGDRVLGTYLHGALEDAAVCSELFRVPVSAGAAKADEYLQLAEWFGRYARRPEEWLA
jgi:adenosylcobyric acid synthase